MKNNHGASAAEAALDVLGTTPGDLRGQAAVDLIQAKATAANALALLAIAEQLGHIASGIDALAKERIRLDVRVENNGSHPFAIAQEP